jgi:hypothetical protein
MNLSGDDLVLRGDAFLILWHDIAPEGEGDYHHWHTKQHMVERLGHPGFKRSRRGVNWEITRQRYFTLYEGEALETFISPEYLASLNEPTHWTNRVAPHFRNFLRCACQVVFSRGRGIGGGLATFRGKMPPSISEQSFFELLRPHLGDLDGNPKVSGVHLGFARRDFSDCPTKETKLRPPMNEDGFDFVLMVESYGLREIQGLVPELAARLGVVGVSDPVWQCYDMAYALEEDEVTGDLDASPIIEEIFGK